MKRWLSFVLVFLFTIQGSQIEAQSACFQIIKLDATVSSLDIMDESCVEQTEDYQDNDYEDETNLEAEYEKQDAFSETVEDTGEPWEETGDTGSIFDGEISGNENGFEYWITDGVLSYLSYKGYEENVIVPDVIAGCQVSRIDGVYNLDVKTIDLPEGLTVIANEAFKGCEQLVSVNLPKTLESIGDEAFYGCKKLSAVDVPEEVTYLGISAFEDCENLKEIVLEDGIQEIPDYAFRGCRNLDNVIIPDSVNRIGDDAFAGCYILKNVLLPDSIKDIGEGLFSDCYSLKEVALPDSLTKIPARMFSYCTALESLFYGDRITEIGERAFYRCDRLDSFILPYSLEIIQSNAFEECKSLEEVYFEEYILSIGENAFRQCPLKNVYYTGSEAEWGNVNVQNPNTELFDADFWVDCYFLSIDEYLELSVNEIENIFQYVIPRNKEKDIKWNTSNSQIASVDGKGNVKGKKRGSVTITAQLKIPGETLKVESQVIVLSKWNRLYGESRYDTMQTIVKEGFDQSQGTVIIATGEGFKDALSAAGFAGLYDAPIILTNGKSLSVQAQKELIRLNPEKIFIAGGPIAISHGVLRNIEKLTSVQPVRLFGQTSSATSAKLALQGKGKWGEVAVIATNKSYKDALSIAPVAYAKHMPILLADNGKSLCSEVVEALKTCGITKVIIVGGEAAVSKNVETQLRKNGIKIEKRIGGKDGAETSSLIAEYGLKKGLSVAYMGVATSQNYPDALAGAAFCGHKNSVLILADDKVTKNTEFTRKHYAAIKKGYIFGGPYAIGYETVRRLEQ